MASATTKQLDKAPAFRWWVLIMNLAIYSVFYISLNAAAAFTVQIQDSWGVNVTMLNMLTTTTQLVYVLFCTIGAAWASKLGDKKVVVIAAALLLASSALFPVVGTTYAGAMVLRVFQGAAGGIMSSSVVATTSLWFPLKQRGLASGILMGCIGLGFSITVAGGNILLGLGFDWQSSLALLVCVPGLVITLLYAFTMKNVSDVYPGYYAIADMMPADPAADAKGPAVDTSKLPGTMAQARKDKKVLALSTVGFICSWLILGFSAFLASLLINDMHIEGGFVASIMSLTFIAGVIGSIMGGIISDSVFKGSRWQTLVISGLLVVVGLLALLVVHGNAAITVMLMLAYLGANMFMGPLWACVPSIVKAEIAGQTTAFANTITNIGGLIVSPILGIVIDATGTAIPALIICVVLAAVSCIASRIIHV